MTDQHGCVVCPRRLEFEGRGAGRRPVCSAPAYSPAQLRPRLNGPTYDAYVAALLQLVQHKAGAEEDRHEREGRQEAEGHEEVGGDAVEELVARIVGRRGHDGLLSINCPSCRHVEDPSPDGCRAMRCSYCAAHFCWVCLRAFDYDAHLHFGHGGGPPDGSPVAHGRQLFMVDMHPELVLAHKQYRLHKVKQVLDGESPEVQRMVLDSARKELKGTPRRCSAHL